MKMRPVVPCGQTHWRMEGQTGVQTDTLTDGRTDRRTDRPTHDDANSRFLQFCKRDALACSGCNTTSHRNSTPGRYEGLDTRRACEVMRPGIRARLVMTTKLYCMLRSHAGAASQNNLKEETAFLTIFILSPCMLLHSLFITNSCTY